MAMPYEAYLDEVTTLITELYGVSEEATIKQARTAAALKQPKPSQQLRQPKQAWASTRKK
jgi:hypothetical protein